MKLTDKFFSTFSFKKNPKTSESFKSQNHASFFKTQHHNQIPVQLSKFNFWEESIKVQITIFIRSICITNIIGENHF